MYQVAFQTHYANVIDMGSVIVCAGSAESARDAVLTLLELPGSRTTTNVNRLKPSIYTLTRKELAPPRPAIGRHFGGDRDQREPERDPAPERFDCQITARVNARGETHALRRLVDALQEKISARGAIVTKHVASLVVNCVPQSRQRHIKPMESVELYQPKRFL
jgi:hypothetical protein